jgi:hypothetical protein
VSRTQRNVSPKLTILGGAFGLAIANAIFNNTVSSNLPTSLTTDERRMILKSTISIVHQLDPQTRSVVIAAYAEGLRTCFIFFTAGSGVCFALSLFIKVSS